MSPGDDQRRPGRGSGVEKVRQATDTSVTDQAVDAPIIGAVHWLAYESGMDPIDNAIQHVETFLAAADAIRAARCEDPSTSFPILGPDIGHDYWARRIVGELLDAGWTPPDVGTVADG